MTTPDPRATRPSLTTVEAQRKVERTADLALRAASLRAERDEARAEVERLRAVWDAHETDCATVESELAALRSGIEALVASLQRSSAIRYDGDYLRGWSQSEAYALHDLRALLAPHDAPSSPVDATGAPEGTPGGSEAQEAQDGPTPHRRWVDSYAAEYLTEPCTCERGRDHR